ncbi:hypothetical protein B0O99DRAFT_665462 [Bisporella sp. PMI_857]|nr:hypothetical protein B0O99DRAFT_665462 [Bisporella sp. PMI_857]
MSVSVALGKVPHTDPPLALIVQETSAIGVSTELGNKPLVLPYFSQNLPLKHPRFFGREDIFNLTDTALLADGAALPAVGQLRTFALCGVGGFDAIVWVAADNRNILYEEYARICTDLQVMNLQDTQDLMAVFKSFDKPLAGSILLTSRNALAKAQVFTATNGCDLEPFNEGESARFLNSLTQHPLDKTDETAIALVQLASGLPLLINQMAGAMRNSNFTRLQMLDMLNAAGVERRVLTLSSKLGLEPLKADSRSLLEIISFLDPDKIPKRLATEKAGFESSINQLIYSSLVLQDTGAKDLRLRRIVQDVVREAMSVPRRVEALTAAVKLVAESWVFIDLLARWKIQRYPECAIIFSSVVRVLSHYQEMFKAGQVPASEIAAHLFNNPGYLLMCGPNAEAEYHLREAHTNISTAAAETNKPQLCLEHSLKYLELALKKTPSTGDLVVDFELGLTYNEAGVAQSMNGQSREALESFRKCAEIWQSLDGYDETIMGLPFGNIGLVHWIEGRYTEALDTLHKMRGIYLRNYGVDDVKTFKTGKVLYALGNVYLSVGDLMHTFEFHGRALNQWQATLGKGHHGIGDVTHKLCMNFMAIKDYRTAHRTYHRNELARSTSKQGQLHAAIGQHDVAEQAFRSAYKLRSMIVPEDERPIQELCEQDYDDIVIYWSR